ncbi:hypothetical protein DPMN_134657 [Dreissena polymorpha]|uniref:Uncharacterized protein n=1 Tax=Dreissena polymorpha TaxID=45954 RepID=A0A9D4G0B4_DREPO|nr:hypothetical protein DPMN_134657 [Dreissena polymorpha]
MHLQNMGISFRRWYGYGNMSVQRPRCGPAAADQVCLHLRCKGEKRSPCFDVPGSTQPPGTE